MSALVTPQLLPTDLPRLEERARELAATAAVSEERVAQGWVGFRLAGRPCAVDAEVVVRAVVRLARPLAVPLAGGGERWVVFVDERPVSLVDLRTSAGQPLASAAALEGRPALLVEGDAGPVAIAVEAPLELVDDRMAAVAAPAETAGPRLGGVLEGGASVLDATWLRAWAGKAARP